MKEEIENGIRPAAHLRKIVHSNSLASRVLSAVEKERDEKINFYSHLDTSYWGDVGANSAIVLDRRRVILKSAYLNGCDWPHRLLFHELGHAFLDTFYHKTDQRMFRKLFGTYNDYPKEGWGRPAFAAVVGNLMSKPSVTRYGRMHGQESFAEAFSWVVCNIDDSDLNPEVIDQLAFVDWMIECVRHKKRSWGEFNGFSVEIKCAECNKDFRLDGCRQGRDIKNWEIECPHCETEIIGA